MANKSVTNSLKILKEKYPDYLGEIYVVQINSTDPEESLARMCNSWESTLQGSKIPDLVLDTTTSGLATETVNAVTAALGLPTVSGEFGQEGDLRYVQLKKKIRK